MSFLFRRFAQGAMVLTGLAGLPAPDQAETREGRVYVAVMDRSGKPIESRPPTAFHVWEDGNTREVVSATRATGPISIVVVVHGMTADTTQSVRKALRSLVETLGTADPNTRIAIVTSVQTPQLVNIRSAAAELENTIDKFVVSGPGLLFLEALADACTVLGKESTDRRIVLAISHALKTDGAAGWAEQAMSAMTQAKGSLWAIHFTPDFQRSNRAATDFEKDNALTNWSVASGGFNDTVFGTTGLPSAAVRMANVLLAQHDVVFRRPAGQGPGALRVGVAGNRGERVVAPAWPIR